MDKCSHPDCISVEANKLVLLPSRWGWESKVYCHDHKKYGNALANELYLNLLSLQKRLSGNPKQKEIETFPVSEKKTFMKEWYVPIPDIETSKSLKNPCEEINKELPITKKPLFERGIVPIQILPVTIENFFVKSYGIFDELHSIPHGYTKFFNSRSSTYFTNENKTILIRISDHWGHQIRYCSWHLKGYKKMSSWKWQDRHGKEKKIGYILFKNLKANDYKDGYEPISRHPL